MKNCFTTINIGYISRGFFLKTSAIADTELSAKTKLYVNENFGRNEVTTNNG